ncbi:MAG: hypothetical protein KatS3mg043_0092 [Rhodothermaceae bacterium]|nr:MAG: hypothetical protein KatS3mg043_0092 [Rhodothermaceae bacterium]
MKTGCFHLAALLPGALADLAASIRVPPPQVPLEDRRAAPSFRHHMPGEPVPCSTNALLLHAMHRASRGSVA